MNININIIKNNELRIIMALTYAQKSLLSNKTILFEEYDLKEWKLVYLQLLQNIIIAPDIVDSEFFTDLQQYLQHKAEGIGIEPLHHETWINWLNNAKDCGVSVSVLEREVLPTSESKQRKEAAN